MIEVLLQEAIAARVTEEALKGAGMMGLDVL